MFFTLSCVLCTCRLSYYACPSKHTLSALVWFVCLCDKHVREVFKESKRDWFWPKGREPLCIFSCPVVMGFWGGRTSWWKCATVAADHHASQEAASRDGKGPGHEKVHKLLPPIRPHLEKPHHFPTMLSITNPAFRIHLLSINQFRKLRTKLSNCETFAGTLCI